MVALCAAMIMAALASSELTDDTVLLNIPSHASEALDEDPAPLSSAPLLLLEELAGHEMLSYGKDKGINNDDGFENGLLSQAVHRHFDTPQVSKRTGLSYQYISILELQVILEINDLRHDGFFCHNPVTDERVDYPPRMSSLFVDCRLWWASKLHAEDMAKRQFFGHDTPQPDGSPPLDFVNRTMAVAWGMVPNVEVLLGVPTHDENTPEQIVLGWLDDFEHCKRMGYAENKLIGMATVDCVGENCHFPHYWVGEFAWTEDTTDDAVVLPEQGVDTSCYPDLTNVQNNLQQSTIYNR